MLNNVFKEKPKEVYYQDKWFVITLYVAGLLHPAVFQYFEHNSVFKGDLWTICRFSYMKVYKLITLGTKFKTLLSLGRNITMFSKFKTNYIEQGWWHSSLTLKCMHLLLKEVNKRGRHAYNLHGWTCLPSGIVMEIHCHMNWNYWGCCEAEAAILLFSVICSWFSKVLHPHTAPWDASLPRDTHTETEPWVSADPAQHLTTRGRGRACCHDLLR